uniref:Uncharacterized protein n=1 Tax=Rhodosorus marinus TaxID=101924 RepID=A0A7S2ZHZ1_9RHOD|mmetsp:Transcript_17825/g.71697  ORF Transcript_17825/g.71697 Transcript_17825/m.71697 type:complete len:166 (+) Transcript_17825:111-608(+)
MERKIASPQSLGDCGDADAAYLGGDSHEWMALVGDIGIGKDCGDAIFFSIIRLPSRRSPNDVDPRFRVLSSSPWASNGTDCRRYRSIRSIPRSQRAFCWIGRPSLCHKRFSSWGYVGPHYEVVQSSPVAAPVVGKQRASTLPEECLAPSVPILLPRCRPSTRLAS